jgi:hypothetical protein
MTIEQGLAGVAACPWVHLLGVCENYLDHPSSSFQTKAGRFVFWDVLI